MKKLLSLVLACLMFCSCASFAAAEEQVEINVWSFTTELEGLLNDYYIPTHPNVKINYTMYPNDDSVFVNKLDPVLATDTAGAEAPDVWALESDWAKRYIESDYTANLLDLGFTEDDFKVDIAATVDFGRDPSGTPKALSWQCTPGALFYRASLAERYLGVTTPEEMQEKVADWDAFMETAEELQEASQGEMKMFNSITDILKPFLYQRQSAWVVDGKFVIDDAIIECMELTKEANDKGLLNEGQAWGETWFAGMKTDITMCYFLPTWGMHYVLKPNSGGEAVGEGTFGDWRICKGPVGYSWGGTWLAANSAKVAQMSDAKKAAVKDLITMLTLDSDTLYAYAKASGDFVSNIAAIEKIVAEGGLPQELLSGQDNYAAFKGSALEINATTKTGYDLDIENIFQDSAFVPYSKGEKDLDTALADFKAQVAAAYPSLIIE
ncbi:MAG: ABC transporter substrate-binding protein [Clostridia bacterium]